MYSNNKVIERIDSLEQHWFFFSPKYNALSHNDYEDFNIDYLDILCCNDEKRNEIVSRCLEELNKRKKS